MAIGSAIRTDSLPGQAHRFREARRRVFYHAGIVSKALATPPAAGDRGQRGLVRADPDISADADPFTGILMELQELDSTGAVVGYQTQDEGGTSLASPIFKTRWRWDASRSLQLLRFQKGRKVAPQIQRIRSDDLLASVFPQAAACFENIEGDIQIPDHPLVRQTIRDCLEDAMDIRSFESLLRALEQGERRTAHDVAGSTGNSSKRALRRWCG